MKFMESGLAPSPSIAGVLLSGILSDTLALRMSTTTHHDRKAAAFLAGLAGIDREELGATLLERGMDLTGTPLADLLVRDTKEFLIAGKKILIAQVMVPSLAWSRDRHAALAEEVVRVRKGSSFDLVLALFTSVIENASDVYGDADPALVLALFGRELPVRLDGVMSRKKDFLPWLGAQLRDSAP
jgi:manganese-dependent inorganic pyrophosphatase